MQFFTGITTIDYMFEAIDGNLSQEISSLRLKVEPVFESDVEKMDIIADEQIIVLMVVEEEVEQEGEEVSRTWMGEISLVT